MEVVSATQRILCTFSNYVYITYSTLSSSYVVDLFRYTGTETRVFKRIKRKYCDFMANLLVFLWTKKYLGFPFPVSRVSKDANGDRFFVATMAFTAFFPPSRNFRLYFRDFLLRTRVRSTSTSAATFFAQKRAITGGGRGGRGRKANFLVGSYDEKFSTPHSFLPSFFLSAPATSPQIPGI